MTRLLTQPIDFIGVRAGATGFTPVKIIQHGVGLGIELHLERSQVFLHPFTMVQLEEHHITPVNRLAQNQLRRHTTQTFRFTL